MSAARLEAEGATEVTFGWRGVDVTVPLDVERWPCDLVRSNPLVAVFRLLGVQRWAVGFASDALVDDVREHARELSHAMAGAVGVAALPETPAAPDHWFGGVPTLLRLLADHEDDVERDLRSMGVDYRDRWRGGLTLRQIWVCIRRSESTSALAVSDNGGKHVWTESDFIGASIYQALTGQVYPGRPLKPDELARTLEAVQAQQEMRDTLRAREAKYASASANPVVSAMAEAEANRRRQLGLSSDAEDENAAARG